DTPLTSPVFITAAPGTNDLFVASQTGKIYIFKNGVAPWKTFLDISGLLAVQNEDGLLGLAFHPNYATNGRFFTFIIAKGTPRKTAIVEFARTAANPDTADAAEKGRINLARKEYPNESGGGLNFGPDGYLYASLGFESFLLAPDGSDLKGPSG